MREDHAELAEHSLDTPESAPAPALTIYDDSRRQDRPRFETASFEETLNTLLEIQIRRLSRANGRKVAGPGDDEAGPAAPPCKLRNVPPESAIIERYRRGKSSVEEVILEIFQADVSMARIEVITSILWQFPISAVRLGELHREFARSVHAWLGRPIRGRYDYVFLDGTRLARTWNGDPQTASVLVAVGVTAGGFREVLGVAEGDRDDEESWGGFLWSLRKRGLHGVKLFVAEYQPALIDRVADVFPGASFQSCITHFYRSVMSLAPGGKVKQIGALVKSIHGAESGPSARLKAAMVAEKLRGERLWAVAARIELEAESTTAFYDFPAEHARSLRTNNTLAQVMLDVRERVRVTRAFSDGASAVALVGARLRTLAHESWARRRLTAAPVPTAG